MLKTHCIHTLQNLHTMSGKQNHKKNKNASVGTEINFRFGHFDALGAKNDFLASSVLLVVQLWIHATRGEENYTTNKIEDAKENVFGTQSIEMTKTKINSGAN